jgi:CDP-diacylglycerol--glycerol-3-phosphate 3-phosphatidyltransferase
LLTITFRKNNTENVIIKLLKKILVSYSSLFSYFNQRRVEKYGKKLPNVLTILRILIVPIFVLLLVDPSPYMSLWACSIFIFASFTDWLDGYIARAFNAQSILGTLLDPLADKVLVMSALVMLTANVGEPRVPAWIVVLLLAREFMVTGLRSLAAIQGIVVAASDIAKHKTAWTFIAIVCLLIKEPYKLFDSLIDFHMAGMVFLWISLILSMYSGIQYAVNLRKVFK